MLDDAADPFFLQIMHNERFQEHVRDNIVCGIATFSSRGEATRLPFEHNGLLSQNTSGGK